MISLTYINKIIYINKIFLQTGFIKLQLQAMINEIMKSTENIFANIFRTHYVYKDFYVQCFYHRIFQAYRVIFQVYLINLE